jgi:hypothetical protein
MKGSLCLCSFLWVLLAALLSGLTTAVSVCDSQPCQNGGVCVDGVSSFVCEWFVFLCLCDCQRLGHLFFFRSATDFAGATCNRRNCLNETLSLGQARYSMLALANDSRVIMFGGQGTGLPKRFVSFLFCSSKYSLI